MASLLARHPAICIWCGWPLAEKPGTDQRRATREHLVPKSHGGGGGFPNLRPACNGCNGARGNDTNWTPTERWSGEHPEDCPCWWCLPSSSALSP